MVGLVIFALLMGVWLVFSEPSLSTMVQVSVAIGTGLLGAAAIYQTLTERLKRQGDEQNRRADRAPHIRLMGRDHLSTHYVAGAGAAPKKAPRVPVPFTELEVVVENVGPGIAGEIKVNLVSAFFDIDYEDPAALREPWELPPSPREVLKMGPKFEESPLRLPSQYLPVGQENRMLLFNADDVESWGQTELDRDTRAFVVEVAYKDLDGVPERSLEAVFYRAEPIPGVDDDEYKNKSRWVRAGSETETAFIEALKVWRLRPQKPSTTSSELDMPG